MGVLLALLFLACKPQASKPDLLAPLKSGLRIENGHYRGTVYTDEQGIAYWMRYMPVTITNGSTIPIHIQVAFEKEYYSVDHKEGTEYKIVPLPAAWAADGKGITTSMRTALKEHIENPTMAISLQMGESISLAIGTLSTECGLLPKALLSRIDLEQTKTCESRFGAQNNDGTQLEIGLDLRLCDNSCILIPCGVISFSGE